MDNEHLFAREETLASWFENALGRFLSVHSSNFQLVKQDNTHVQVAAAAGPGAAAIAVQGRWRWVEAPVSRAHPGGGAGTYLIFVTATETSIVSSPAPYTDTTDYSFALAILPVGASPTIVAGALDLFRQVGSLQWDGAKITRIDQTVPAAPLHARRHATGQPDAIAPSDIGAATAVPLVTALPGGPSDGQLVDFLADPVAGVVWRFRYRSAAPGAFKWEFVGGPPLQAQSNVQQAIVAAGGWANLPADNVELTLPVLPTGGDFDITVGGQLNIAVSANGGGGAFGLSYGITGSAPVQADGIWIQQANTDGGAQINVGSAGQITSRKLAVASASTVRLEAQLLFGGMVNAAAQLFSARLAIRPVRVG